MLYYKANTRIYSKTFNNVSTWILEENERMCDCKCAQQYLFGHAFLMEYSGHSNENFFREKKTFKKIGKSVIKWMQV